jgi:hypothetical protein
MKSWIDGMPVLDMLMLTFCAVVCALNRSADQTERMTMKMMTEHFLLAVFTISLISHQRLQSPTDLT